MTYERVSEAVVLYNKVLGAHSVEQDAKCRLCHCRWMVNEITTWPPERLEKAFRWLGFIQGVFWCEGVYTIDEMRVHNMPATTEEQK